MKSRTAFYMIVAIYIIVLIMLFIYTSVKGKLFTLIVYLALITPFLRKQYLSLKKEESNKRGVQSSGKTNS